MKSFWLALFSEETEIISIERQRMSFDSEENYILEMIGKCVFSITKPCLITSVALFLEKDSQFYLNLSRFDNGEIFRKKHFKRKLFKPAPINTFTIDYYEIDLAK